MRDEGNESYLSGGNLAPHTYISRGWAGQLNTQQLDLAE